MSKKNKYEQIAHSLSESEVLILLTGAGMSADSGIPTYRGENAAWGNVEGEREGAIFDIMNPAYLEAHPVYMWQRFGRRIHFFDEIVPHVGHDIILKWIQKYHLDYFCVTSNIDAQLQKSGFLEENIFELHGNIYRSQCSVPCNDAVWDTVIDFDVHNPILSPNRLPNCPRCGALARPNCLIFRDKQFVKSVLDKQRQKWYSFLEHTKDKKILVFEIGAGTHLPTIRSYTKNLVAKNTVLGIRINPQDFEIEMPHIGVRENALKAILTIDDYCKVHQINKKIYKSY